MGESLRGASRELGPSSCKVSDVNRLSRRAFSLYTVLSQSLLPSRPRTMQKREQKRAIKLQGSTKLVTELFEYSVNSILYQRGIYPPEDFKCVLPLPVAATRALPPASSLLMPMFDDCVRRAQVRQEVRPHALDDGRRPARGVHPQGHGAGAE